MKGISSIPPHMRAVEPIQEARGRCALWFSVAFIALEFAILAFSLFIATLPWFTEQSYIPALRMSGYSRRAAGMACEIVLYGDSTALAGLNPAVIQAETGMKTCNISEVRSVGDFVGLYFPVDDYLARNPPPKYLVTAWSPTNFHLNHAPGASNLVEGYAYALRYHPGPWLWKAMLMDPRATLNFLVWAQGTISHTLLIQLMGRSSVVPDQRALRASLSGMWSFPNPPQTACEGRPAIDVPSNYEENREGVAAFRKRYEKRGIRVIVDVTPIANCNSELQADIPRIEGLYDNRLEVLPIQNFNSQDIHLTPEAAVQFSTEVADQIRSLTTDEEGRAR